MNAQMPRSRNIMQSVTTNERIWHFTWKKALTAPMRPPVAMPPRMASGRLICESAQKTAQETPSMEPWEKSRHPMVMISHTPQAAIMSMYPPERIRVMFLIVRMEPFVAMAKKPRITTNPMSGRSPRTRVWNAFFLISSATGALGSSVVSFEVVICSAS